VQRKKLVGSLTFQRQVKLQNRISILEAYQNSLIECARRHYNIIYSKAKHFVLAGKDLEFTRWTKVWVTITLCSLLVYELYWVYGVFGIIYRTFSLHLSIGFPSFYLDTLFGATGDALRVIGVCLSLLAIYLFWGPRSRAFTNVKKYVAVTLLFEAVFWLLASPITIIEFLSGRIYSLLPIAYILAIFLVSPLLIVLAIKVWRFQKNDKYQVLKWAGVAAIGYLTGIWIINVFRWFSMAQSAGLGFLFSGTTFLGFLNAVVTLSLALILAVFGFYIGLRRRNGKLAIRLWALALIMLGLFFAIFILYTAVTNSWNYLLITEIWPIPFLGLGVGMLRGKI
jgi:hypothetical protein